MAATNGHSGEDAHPSNAADMNSKLDYDVLIVGAGLSGIFSLYRVRELGLRVKVLEAGPAEGGTWFW